MADAVSFQAERGSLLSLWRCSGAAARRSSFQAAVIAGIAGAARPRSGATARLAADPRRMAALGAAVLLGVQLAANYWSLTYLAWVFPLVALGAAYAVSASGTFCVAPGGAPVKRGSRFSMNAAPASRKSSVATRICW